MRAPEERAHFAIQAALADRSNVDLSWLNRLHASNEWTMAMDVLQFLTSLVSHLKPKHIIEFGSGLSTLVLARACSKYSPSCRITSVDHDPKFRQIGIRQFLNRNIDCFVKLQLAPLVARECVGRWVPMYFLRPKHFASAKPTMQTVRKRRRPFLSGKRFWVRRLIRLYYPDLREG